MNSKIIWTDQVPDKDGVKNPINDISMSPGTTCHTFYLVYAGSDQIIASLPPVHQSLCFCFLTDGTRVIIGVGNRVLLYDGNTGDLIESLRG